MAGQQGTAASASAALVGSLKDFAVPKGKDLFSRIAGFYEWQSLRRKQGVWPYARSIQEAPRARCTVAELKSKAINFGSQDYLGLSTSPEVKQAAIEAIQAYGVHSAGSAALLGNSKISFTLEQELSDFLNDREVVLYPTGWGAGYGAIQGLVRPADHVVLDILSHSCLQAGARAGTQNIHYYRHCDPVSLERKLSRIRRTDSKNAILVVTESLFSMHANVPELAVILEICHRYDAAMVVDCAHDFGCMGQDGLGQLAIQGVLDSVDVIVGSFSKTFASNGGFVAVKSRATAEYLKYYSATHTFSNALSAAQAAAVLTALRIVRSERGETLRRQLMSNVLKLRQRMQQAGLKVLGVPSPIVPIEVGGEALGRLAAKALASANVIANLVEYPAVPLGESRFRFQVMPQHDDDDIAQIAAVLKRAVADGGRELAPEAPVMLDQISAA